MTTPEKTAPELMAALSEGERATMNEYMRRAPKDLTNKDLDQWVEIERKMRTIYIGKELAK